MANNDAILTLSCDDRPGITGRVTTAIFENGGDITEAQQFGDREDGRFFMRVQFAPGDRNIDQWHRALEPLASDLAMDWTLRDTSVRRKILIMVSKSDHCLVDLLYRVRIGELAAEIVGVASNHPREAQGSPLLREIPYHHLPITKDTKSDQEAKIRELVEASGAELVVLARYMQILSDDMARHLAGRCINIHHSFLPGFKGARPYHQAHARGVKMIGATAHYVTSDLDEGPIIHQDVEPITHADAPDSLVRKGRDIERRVLAEAVRLHLEDRVLLNGSRTVVFRG